MSIARVPALAVAAIALAACGDEERGAGEERGVAESGAASAGAPADSAPSDRPRASEVERPKPVPCPADATNCAGATGEIVYVEAVDPDGDGDAHFVLAGSESITGPGITVVDVAKDLRPHPLPGVGETLSAAGPVYRGSYGQRQIEATKVRVAGR